MSAPQMSSLNEMPGSVFNTQILITTLITVFSVLIGFYLGTNLSSKKSTSTPKIIVREVVQIAETLAKVQEGSEKYTDEVYCALINTLIQLLDENNHPDVDIIHYIASEVANKRHPSQIYEVWLTLAFRRLSIDPFTRLPEPWFIEPIAPSKEPEPELDLSEISESSTDDEFENEAVPLISPISSKPSFDDDLNTARIYTPQSNLIDLDVDISLLTEVGLPQHLDMSAVD
jgi:hypothetical protein